jgi:hypothetical protein
MERRIGAQCSLREKQEYGASDGQLRLVISMRSCIVMLTHPVSMKHDDADVTGAQVVEKPSVGEEPR